MERRRPQAALEGAAEGGGGFISGGGAIGGGGGGRAFSGTAYEFKHVAKHIEGSAAAERLIAREGAAHVFTDMETLETVENAIFSGVVRFAGQSASA